MLGQRRGEKEVHSEAAEVTEGTIAHARNIELSFGRKRQSCDQFGGYIKISQSYISFPGFRSKVNDFVLNGKGCHTTQHEHIPFPGAKTEDTGARVKISPSKLRFALK